VNIHKFSNAKRAGTSSLERLDLDLENVYGTGDLDAYYFMMVAE
jgi:hypothetical protein